MRTVAFLALGGAAAGCIPSARQWPPGTGPLSLSPPVTVPPALLALEPSFSLSSGTLLCWELWPFPSCRPVSSMPCPSLTTGVVCLGCYNQTPQTAQCTDNRRLFLTVLEVGWVLVRACFRAAEGTFTLCPHVTEWAKGLCGASCEALVPSVT